MPRSTRNGGHFVSANRKAKSAAVAVLVRAARRARLDYDGFLYICQQARRRLKLTRPPREHKLPHLLPDSALKRFFRRRRRESAPISYSLSMAMRFATETS